MVSEVLSAYRLSIKEFSSVDLTPILKLAYMDFQVCCYLQVYCLPIVIGSILVHLETSLIIY
jgi:hypothetical protein